MAGTSQEAAAAYKRGDFAQAFHLWHGQAEQGDYDAQAMVAFLYHDGEGVTKDLVRAHMWFEISRSNSPADEQSWHDASEALDSTAKSMTAKQIAEARAMAQNVSPRSTRTAIRHCIAPVIARSASGKPFRSTAWVASLRSQ